MVMPRAPNLTKGLASVAHALRCWLAKLVIVTASEGKATRS